MKRGGTNPLRCGLCKDTKPQPPIPRWGAGRRPGRNMTISWPFCILDSRSPLSDFHCIINTQKMGAKGGSGVWSASLASAVLGPLVPSPAIQGGFGHISFLARRLFKPYAHLPVLTGRMNPYLTVHLTRPFPHLKTNQTASL